MAVVVVGVRAVGGLQVDGWMNGGRRRQACITK